MPVASIPASQPFLDTLAAGLAALGEQDADPLALPRVTVLLPTRRSCRALREALLRARAGRAALLPRIVPLGDLDEEDGPGLDTLALPSPLPALTRQLMLTRLILARGEDMTPAQATRLAVDLARLLDQAHTEEIDIAAIAALPVKEELAHHWQVTLDFLGLLIDVWPPLLQEWGAVDPALHRSLGLKAQAQAWRERPPAGRIIAAGSTGSIPAAADVLKVVADLPHGLVILPGLDTSLDDASWEALEDTHPQAALKRLLDRFGLTRAQVGSCEAFLPPLVPPTPLSPAQDARARLVTLALRPAATTEAWRHLGESGDTLCSCRCWPLTPPSHGRAFSWAWSACRWATPRAPWPSGVI
ncbi:hypothetical protein [Pararhodospirillum photometricum]|uniref:hypothetical protein n=1 Tax=Pararhodospirillum photometricum TaxID=1084 RepID=UPI0002D54361|nr:hypothetical protein [Pararhodospirillum photometricum]